MSGIKAGDLVMVVRAPTCGCRSVTMGIPFCVAAIRVGRIVCKQCGKFRGPEATVNAQWPNGDVTECWRLKKLDGLPSSIEHKQKEEV